MEIYECVNKNKGDPGDTVYLDFQKASPKAIKKTKLPQAVLGGTLWQVQKSLLASSVDRYALILA